VSEITHQINSTAILDLGSRRCQEHLSIPKSENQDLARLPVSSKGSRFQLSFAGHEQRPPVSPRVGRRNRRLSMSRDPSVPNIGSGGIALKIDYDSPPPIWSPGELWRCDFGTEESPRVACTCQTEANQQNCKYSIPYCQPLTSHNTLPFSAASRQIKVIFHENSNGFVIFRRNSSLLTKPTWPSA
jgi:hypothetical protein